MRDFRNNPFWEEKRLEDLDKEEWEALCDRCGRCCLNKLEDWDTGEIAWTNVACRLFDDGSCRCSNYGDRFQFVPDCVQLTPETVREIEWLPPTCAYRLVADGQPLRWWHPLVSGDPETVHAAGISARSRTISEEGMALEKFEEHLVTWPGVDPAPTSTKVEKPKIGK